jgi:serine phosphatase RsbU (regulator of sigma subunit)
VAIVQVNSLVQATLAHNLLRSDELERRMAKRQAELEAWVKTLPEAEQFEHLLVLRHAQTIMRQQALVEPLLSKITSAELDQAALELSTVYGTRLERATAASNRYRVALYGFTLALLLGLLVIGLKLRGVYAHLEVLVLERTEQLNSALRALWGEMELAKKIQTSLVPHKPTLRNCEVAAVMLPAEEVGGDYYDVIAVGNTEWILIGDVSGHGVSAGLVMMMCQTAVRTALGSHPNIAPDRLLTVVNQALTENIRRLGEDKYMTISALCRSEDGRFHFCGLHQDLLIYRASLDTVECIEATGTCLGLSDSISEQLPVGQFALASGDVLLLYTDGVTEAARDGVMLDGAGLSRLLKELGRQSAEEIVHGIVTHLQVYSVTDDVTALAIKQS